MNKPERKFRAGGVTATIWTNMSAKGSYSTVQLERSYKDKEDQWKSTGAMREADLPKAALVLQKAYEFLTVKVAEGGEGNMRTEESMKEAMA